jgi:hypothetical protein
MIGVVIIEHTERERKAYKIIVTHILSSMKIDFAYPKAEFLLDSFQEETTTPLGRRLLQGGMLWLGLHLAQHRLREVRSRVIHRETCSVVIFERAGLVPR